MGGYEHLRTQASLQHRVVWSKHSYMDLGRHVFPVHKYELIFKAVRKDLDLADRVFVHPEPCREGDLLLVHTPEHIHKLKTNTLEPEEILQLEIPLTPSIFRSFCYNVGGTMRAARLAAEQRAPVVHLGGGFHHAFADHGEGFCL